MSRPKSWLPNATPLFVERPEFMPDEAAWTAIEAALAAPLVGRDRRRLTQIASDYLAKRAIEIDLPLESDARLQIEAIEGAATALEAALTALADGTGSAGRIKKMFDIALREVCRETGGPISLGALHFISPAPQMLQLAAAKVRHGLAHETDMRKPMFAFDELVERLGKFASAKGVRPSIRNDGDVSGKVSQFERFVSSLQSSFPAELRVGTGGPTALGAQIKKAMARNREK